MSYVLALADCLDYLPTVPSGSVDAVIVDLPYGTTQLVWDKTIDLERMWQQVYRVCKPSAVQVMFSAQPFTTDLINSNRKRFRYAMVWEKTMAAGFLSADKRPLKSHEDILVFGTNASQSTYNPQKWKADKMPSLRRYSPGATSGAHYGSKDPITAKAYIDDGSRYPVSVLTFANGGRTDHPTQKSLELLCYLVKTYTNPGDTVLDFCAGSGTTHAACLLTGRYPIGCEIDPSYHVKAVQRLEAIQAQPQLFIQPQEAAL